jgi:fructokinase
MFVTETVSSKKPLWGIDLGGTKIEGAILDPANPLASAIRLRRPTGSSLGYDHILNEIASLISDLERETGTSHPDRIGIGTPGTTVPSSGLIKNSNTLCLNDRPLKTDLAALLGCEVITANDADCFALAEASLGAAKGRNMVFGIILGTGVGGGIILDGKAGTGPHGIRGEWGHNTLPGETTPCYCGRSGCLETVCSGPALERWYLEKSGTERKLPEIADLARKGDVTATATLSRLAEKFAAALGPVINLLDPDAIVIGGGVGNLDILYSMETRNLIRSHLFNDRFETPLLKPSLGDSAGVFGAAMLSI